jgi:hypothetical protein
MDATRFDRLTRRVGRQTDRRGMLKAVVGGGLGLLGASVLGRGASADTGFEGDTCTSGADCKQGLVCEGASPGLLGGSLAGIPYGPGVEIPLVSGSTGTCRYHQGDRCGKVDQSCERTSDCCNGLGLTCRNKKCKR